MKKILAMLFAAAACFAASSSMANPFHTRFVCVPANAADEGQAEFRIRDQGQCTENETYMEVRSGGDGSTLLLPAKDSLTPEEQKDLERYRKFYGGENPPGTPE